MALFHTTVLDEQIKALPTVDTASGSIATFDTDMTENLVSVKCQIVAQQSGSGTPSPSNPRPITTHTEMNVIRVGKNLVIGKLENYTIGSSGNITGESGRAMNFAPVKQGETYTITTDDVSNFVGGYFTEIPKSGSISYNGQRIISNYKTVTAPIDGYIAFRSTDTYATAQCEKGSFATAFEPQGLYANIPFGQTVAQGLLNVVTGKLRVTHEIVDLGSLYWNYISAYSFFNSNIVGKKIGVDNAIVSNYAYGDWWSSWGDKDLVWCGNSANSNINIKDTNYTDSTAFKTALQNANAKMVYELDTPIEIQLSSTQITALLNENNIWCDTGDTEVKFLLTVGKKIS